jgi:hypothetical protein|tara:strand:+ start:781 stop:975 length:195 start_codon:yes stop_codon:yes gene_type:complete
LTIDDVRGLTVNKTIRPKNKEVIDKRVITLRFEYPNILREIRSVFDFIDIKYHIEEIKIIKGKS